MAISKEGEIKVKSLQKALDILNCFIRKSSWGVTELSEYLGLNKSNVHSILSTFTAMEYLRQDKETGKYKLGLAVYTLCHALGDELIIGNIAQPYMQELSDWSGEQVYLGVPYGDEVIYVNSAYPMESINLMRTIMGERTRMYCTGLGKAMMAYLPNEDVNRYLQKELPACTDYTITDPETLRAELKQIRERGYAIDNMEHEFGIKCVGMPILNRQQKLEAAISISGPSLRFSPERIPVLVEKLRKTVTKIEKRL